ncbi:hypothetical protein BDZ45DRAFT_742013 [Acephala macrosclerotiorum]|nr:hypothetical protein BDZ45DRAFT_742013 [Acephala macrosclerotiorum]
MAPVPIPRPPTSRSSALLWLFFIAGFIGASPNLSIVDPDLGVDEVAAYAGHLNGKLEKVAVINFEVCQTRNGTRHDKIFKLKMPKGVKSVVVDVNNCVAHVAVEAIQAVLITVQR